MARFVPLSLLLLFFLVVIVTSSDEVLSSPEVVDGGSGVAPDDDDLVCDTVFDPCVGSCWRSGRCLSCCQYHGFVHGKCSLKDGEACYCCHTPDHKMLSPPSPLHPTPS